MLPSMTMQEIRLAAQQRADMVNSDFVTNEEWGQYINAELYTLYDMMIAAQPTGYFSTLPPYQFTTDGTSQYFDLPADFYKLQGVDLALSSAPNGSVTLKPFNFAERNRFSALGGAFIPTGAWWTVLRYRLLENTLMLTPLAQGGQIVTIWYVPKLIPLVEIAQIVCTGFSSSDNPVPTNATLVFNQYEYEFDGTNYNTPTEAAESLAAIINDQFGASGATAALGIVATSSLNVITMTIPSTVTTVTYSSNTQYLACSASEIRYGSTTFDGFSGWLDRVVLAAAMRALKKEESDTAVLAQELAGIDARIARMADNRDVGAPASVVDVYATGNAFPGDWQGM